jgi:glycosyltransferase involved in cell wall biosynthesis
VVSEGLGGFQGEHNASSLPGVRVRRVGVPGMIKRLPYGVRIARLARFALIGQIEQIICEEVKRGAERIVAVYPSWPFFIAAYRAHLRTSIPLFTYQMDVTGPPGMMRGYNAGVCEKWEATILRAASRRLVLTQALADDLQARFRLDSTVIPHSINTSVAPPDPGSVDLPVIGTTDERMIVHTGVVEQQASGGLLRIADAIAKHPEWNVRLVLSTPSDRDHLLANGFDRPFISILSLRDEQVFALQQRAHLTVAVVSFHRAEEDDYESTIFPTKLIEYMKAGPPILVHAPPRSFLTRHAQLHGYAIVANSKDGTHISAILKEALENTSLRSHLASRGRAVVEEIFSLRTVARKFAETCDLSPSILN